MKRFITIALVASFGLTAGTAYALDGTIGKPVSSVSAYAVGDAANGIHESRHNLGSMGNFLHSDGADNTEPPASLTNRKGTSEVCVFCHTPHHSLPPWVPSPWPPGSPGPTYPPPYPIDALWNKASQAPSSSFKAYGTTIGGTVIANGDIGGTTLACLSCHDGITAFDVMVNAPGAGLGNPATPYGSAGSVWGLTPTTGTGPWANTGFTDELGGAGKGANNLGAEARLNIGNTGGDLSNDHPLSVVYSDGNLGTTKRASLRDRNTVIGGIDLYTGLATSTTNSAELVANLSQNKWAVKGFISDTAKISDLLWNDKVECTSCHDPHFKNLSNVDLNNTEKSAHGIVAWSDGLFLRRVGGNAGSGVCRTCHNK